MDKLVMPFSGQEVDSLELVDYSIVIDLNFANSYERIKKRKSDKIVCADCEDIIWKDSVNSWALNKDDIRFMINEVKMNKKIKWNFQKFKTKITSITTVNYPKLAAPHITDKERAKRIKNNHYIFAFSTPIFNKKKNIAVVSYSNVFLNFGETLIYKKIKNNWELIGEFQ